VGVRNAFDDAVEAQTAKVVGHPSDGICGWIDTQQLCQKGSHFLIVEPTELETEYDQNTEQGLHALVTEPQCRRSLAIHLDRTDYPIEGIFADRAIVGNLLDVEKTSVGLEADLPESGQVLQ
jgi:hypothetical protein